MNGLDMIYVCTCLDLQAIFYVQTNLMVLFKQSTIHPNANITTVDICITTPWKELEGVCMLAELLAKRKPEYLA